MNSDNSDYIIFHINYDPPGKYQFVNHIVYLTRCYKGIVLDKWLHKSISLLAVKQVKAPFNMYLLATMVFQKAISCLRNLASRKAKNASKKGNISTET